MKLKALKYIRYAGKPVQQGEVFECRDADVRVLLAIRTAEKYVEPPKRSVPAVFKPIPEVRVRVTPEGIEPHATTAAEQAAAEEYSEKPRRSYKRRDMTAE